MASETTVRPYDPARDLAPVSVIWFAASLAAHPFLGVERLREHRLLVERDYLQRAETWVACRAGAPVGFISLFDTFVGGLFTAPAHQRRGIGRALVGHALRLKRVLELDVYTANAQAMGFYAALGFTERARRPTDDEGLPFENARMVLAEAGG